MNDLKAVAIQMFKDLYLLKTNIKSCCFIEGERGYFLVKRIEDILSSIPLENVSIDIVLKEYDNARKWKQPYFKQYIPS
jgi:hypothetical protein